MTRSPRLTRESVRADRGYLETSRRIGVWPDWDCQISGERGRWSSQEQRTVGCRSLGRSGLWGLRVRDRGLYQPAWTRLRSTYIQEIRGLRLMFAVVDVVLTFT
jgi:hypothetical protein